MNRIATLLVALAVAGCVDYGVKVAPLESETPDGAGGTSGGGGAGTDCEEGVADPGADGPQLVFAGLAVDQRTLVIAVGDVVTWTNQDSMPHNAISGAPGAEQPAAQGGFTTSPNLAPGTQWAWRFCDPRTVLWFCGIHAAQMNGYQIVVE